MKQHIEITEAQDKPNVTEVSRLPGAIVGICLAMTVGFLLLSTLL